MTRRAKGEGSIFRQKDGRWVGRVDLGPDPLTGRRRRRKVTAATKTGAAKRLQEMRLEISSGIDSADRATLGALVDRWLERVVSDKSDAMRNMYMSLARTHLPPLAAIKVDQLTVRQVEDWLDARSHLSRSTLKKLRSLVAQVLDYGRKYRMVNINVAREADLPPGSSQKRRPRSLTRAEAALLLRTAANHRLEAWLHVMLGTGARPGEVNALVWGDVDLDAGTVRIVATKTGGQVRVLRVSPSVVDKLRIHQKQQAEERLLMGDAWPEEHNLLVFCSEGGTPLDASNARRFVKHVAAAANIDHLTPYELRHTHASILSDSGTHAEALADRLGHRDSRTTLNYYRHQITPVIEVGSNIDFAECDE